MSSEGAGPIGQRETERRTWKSARGESVRGTSVEIVPTEEPSNYSDLECVRFIVTNLVTSLQPHLPISKWGLIRGPFQRDASITGGL